MLCLGGTRGRADATASPLRCGISTPPMTASGPEILTCGGHVHAIEDLPDGVEVALERLGREPARDQLQDIVLRVVARAGELGVERLARTTTRVVVRRRPACRSGRAEEGEVVACRGARLVACYAAGRSSRRPARGRSPPTHFGLV